MRLLVITVAYLILVCCAYHKSIEQVHLAVRIKKRIIWNIASQSYDLQQANKIHT